MTRPAGPAAWLAHWARRTPSAPALITPFGRRLTFRELDRRVDAVCAALAGRGVGRNTLICVQTHEPLETRLLRLAANRYGVADVLFDPAAPGAEVSRRLEVLGNDVMFIDADHAAEICARPFVAFGATPDATSPARVLFTTGSTGSPRAVLHLNRHLESAASCNAAARGLRSDDVVLAALPPHHAAGSLFEDTALFVGAAVALVRRGSDTASNRLIRALHAHRPTVVTVVPSLIRDLVDDGDGIGALSVLRLLNYAGEIASPDMVERLTRAFPGELYRGYGLTEAGPIVAVLSDADHRSGTPPHSALGRPAPGVSVRLRALGDGSNELLVKSGHVMEGYVNNPEATARAVRDGWLHTGDLVTMEDGLLLHTGRLGSRIRSGAEWIDLDEVRRALERTPSITSAAVVAIASDRWGHRPVAFVTGTGELELSRVHDHLAGELPRFKWPDQIRVLAQLPRTATGKVDHDLLRRMAG